METVTVKCLECDEPVAVPKSHANWGGICERCAERGSRESAILMAKGELARRWLGICPPNHIAWDTILEQLPCQDKTAKALTWPFNQQPHGYGLVLWGTPRTGKTRTMWLILKREHFAGKRVQCFDPGFFVESFDRATGKRGPWLKRLASLDILAFDDVDKCKFPRKVEDAFFAIVNARTAHKKPLFFTGNADGDALKLKFHLGEPLIARIREFCIPIHFP